MARAVGTRDGESGGPPAAARRRAAHVVLLIVLPCALYAGTVRNGLHLDDFPRIVDNPEIDRVWPPWRHFLDPRTGSVIPQVAQYRPLLPLTLSLDRAAADALGIDRLVMLHAVSIAIHVGTTLVIFALLLALLPRSGLPGLPLGPHSLADTAFAAALLFAIHPVSGVPVNYLCARDQLLMALFFAAFLKSHASARLGSGAAWRLWLAAAWLVPAILSKTDAVAAPLVVLAFELTFGGGRLLAKRTWLAVVPSAVVVAGFFGFTKLVLGFSDADQLLVPRESVLEYPLTQLEVHVTHYLRNFAWPFRLRPLPEIEPVASLLNGWSLVGLGIIGASVVVAWRLRSRVAIVAFALAAYWSLLAPTSSILPFRLFVTDYRPYPALPWLCLLVVLAGRAILPARARLPAFVLLAAWFGGSSLVTNGYWKDEETLWGQSVRHGGATMAHHNYAMAIQDRDPAAAERHFKEALRLAPENVRSEISLGLMLMRLGRVEEGYGHVKRAVDMSPTWALTHYWHARALGKLGRREEAARESARAADMEPRDPKYAYQAAWDAQAVRRHDDCLRYIAQMRAQADAVADSGFIEGWCLQAKGRLEEAIVVYRGFLEGSPRHVQARFNLGHALMKLGRHAEAITELERVLEVEPAYHEVHLHLSRCHAALGATEKAEAENAAWEARPR